MHVLVVYVDVLYVVVELKRVVYLVDDTVVEEVVKVVEEREDVVEATAVDEVEVTAVDEVLVATD